MEAVGEGEGRCEGEEGAEDVPAGKRVSILYEKTFNLKVFW